MTNIYVLTLALFLSQVELKDQYAKDLVQILTNFENYMKNKKWLAGDNVSIIYDVISLWKQNMSSITGVVYLVTEPCKNLLIPVACS